MIDQAEEERAMAEDAYPDGWTCNGCGEEFHGVMPAQPVRPSEGTVCVACRKDETAALQEDADQVRREQRKDDWQ